MKQNKTVVFIPPKLMETGMSSASSVPRKVVVKEGRVLFGLGQQGDSAVIILPRFNIKGDVKKIAEKVKRSQRYRQDGHCELLLKNHLKDAHERLLFHDGDMVPTDQCAATVLLQMGFKMKQQRFYVPLN